MDWKTLLSTEKLIAMTPEPHVFSSYPINEFEKDYNRIVSSAAFRRLQDKTQVFPLDKSDFVRTRLTHSIEVSTIARQLGIMISKNNTQYKPTDIDLEDAEGISSVLLCAGLLHDLGNPPFGHFGETVIGDWFKKNLSVIKYKGAPLNSLLNEQMISDLENFEGNAQALRILLKAKHDSGINLSFSIISALVKYPTDSLSFNKKDLDVKKHKLGYFVSEKDVFRKISETIGTINKNGEICRHPLTYILEAADDIAYATADLEDAFKKDLFTLDTFIDFFKDSYSSKTNSSDGAAHYSEILINDLFEFRNTMYTPERDVRAFEVWLDHVRRWLMYVSVFRFSYKYPEIMNGTYDDDLFKNTNHSLTIEILKKAMGEFVFDTPSILKLELSAQTILSFLLEKFIYSVLYYDVNYQDKENGFIPSTADKKYLTICSDNFKQDYNAAKTGDEIYDLYLRLLMVTDYISGMTDSYARTLYRELSGIE